MIEDEGESPIGITIQGAMGAIPLATSSRQIADDMMQLAVVHGHNEEKTVRLVEFVRGRVLCDVKP